jgi:hypothetical protein
MNVEPEAGLPCAFNDPNTGAAPATNPLKKKIPTQYMKMAV